MKKLIKVSVLIFIISFLGACEKSNLKTEIEKPVEIKVTPNEEQISYTIPANLLEKELLAIMDGRQKNNFEFNRAQLKYLDILDQFEIIIVNDSDELPYQTVCSGNGYAFASCVGNYLKDNPGKCLVISYSVSEDSFNADDECGG